MKTSKQDFDLFVERVKKTLGITSDKEFAEILELPTSTYNRWKKEGKFPETELRALSHKRPDLNIDFDYIYTGTASKDFANSDREGGIPAFATAFLEPDTLSEEEKHLIRLFRIIDGHAKDSLLLCAEGMAYKHTHSPYEGVLEAVRRQQDQAEKHSDQP